MNWPLVDTAARAHPHHGLPQVYRTDPMEYASAADEIRYSDAAWLGPSPCPKTSPNAWSTEESTPCALSRKIEPDSRGLVPAIHVLERWHKQGVDARHKAGHDELRQPRLALL